MTDGEPSLHSTTVGGEGAPVVVFLHGLFGQGRNFTQVAKLLTPDLTSVLLDLPNHGRSPWTGHADYRSVAATTAAWLDDSGLADDGPVHVVGHSMGGKVAMVLALTRPDLVRRLVVVDISPAPSDGAGEFEHLLGSLARLDLPTLARRADAETQLAADVDDARVRGFLLQNLRSGPDGFRWAANLDLLRRELPAIGDFPPVAGTFDHPVLWIAGARSDYVRPEHAPEMRRLFPRTTAVTIKGAGHWVHAEQPEAFASAVRTFLTAADH